MIHFVVPFFIVSLMHVLTAKISIQYSKLQICLSTIPKSAAYALIQSGEIRNIKKKKKEWDQDLHKLLFGAINETSCKLVESIL